MTEERDADSKRRLAKKFDQSLVEELYELADIIQSADDRLEIERKRIAAERMAQLLKDSQEGETSGMKRNLEHRWILDVLFDLIRYAETHDLAEIDRVISETRFKAAQILNREG